MKNFNDEYKAAESGSIESLLWLTNFYYENKNYKEAYKWYLVTTARRTGEFNDKKNTSYDMLSLARHTVSELIRGRDEDIIEARDEALKKYNEINKEVWNQLLHSQAI